MAMFKSRCLRPDARARKCFFVIYHGKCFEEKTQESKFEDEANMRQTIGVSNCTISAFA